MTELDSFPILRRWNDLVLSGADRQIEAFLLELGRSLPPDWSRDASRERDYGRRGAHPGSACFVREPRTGVKVTLWLLRTKPEELQGGVVESSDRARYYPDAAEAILEFEWAALKPAAGATGVAIRSKRPGPRTVLPEQVRVVLNEYLDCGERGWPQSERAGRAWRKLVIAAYQSETLLDPDEFRRWLVDSHGYSRDEAEQLFARLLADSRILSEYESERQSA
ncbi:MAG: hypothetical protein C0501_09705 [Isosphaera sp.]|nr:hypothetical protein [Isosphaera sp.]